MFVKQCKLGCVSVVDLFVWQVLIQQWYNFTVIFVKNNWLVSWELWIFSTFYSIAIDWLLLQQKIFSSHGNIHIWPKFYLLYSLCNPVKGQSDMCCVWSSLVHRFYRGGLNGTFLKVFTVPNSHLRESSYFYTNILCVFHLLWKD